MQWLKAAAIGAVIAALSSAARADADPALWNPSPATVAALHQRCANAGGDGLGPCVAAAMTAAGAPAAAVAFAERLPMPGYMRKRISAGKIAVALVDYPFRANENSVWLLIGGTPDLIDVDDQSRLPQDALHRNPRYRALAGRYPNISLWPGDRGAAGPAIATRAGGGVSITVRYQLHDGCHACAVIGGARFAFDFDGAGRLEGTRLVGVDAS